MGDESAGISWIAATGAVALAVFTGWVGYVFGRKNKSADDKQVARGLLIAIKRDVERGTELFRAYRRPGRGSPAWRLPVQHWTDAFPVLAGMANVVNANELMTIARFFDAAVELNYCLDRIRDGAHGETGRALLKVQHALDIEQPYPEPLVVRALAAADAALARLD